MCADIYERIDAARKAAAKTMTDGQLAAKDAAVIPKPDSLIVSAFIGRGMILLASIGAFCNAVLVLWAKVGPLVADGISVPDAIAILNQSGPVLAASSDLWAMVLSGISAVIAAISKARSIARWSKIK